MQVPKITKITLNMGLGEAILNPKLVDAALEVRPDQVVLRGAGEGGAMDTPILDALREVALGELTRIGVEVLDGLAPGDRVITAGVSVIRDGQRVLIP